MRVTRTSLQGYPRKVPSLPFALVLSTWSCWSCNQKTLSGRRVDACENRMSRWGCHVAVQALSVLSWCVSSPPVSLAQSPVHSVEGCRVQTREETHLLAFRIFIRSSMQEPNICSASESVGCERDACGQRGVRTAKYAVRTARNAQSEQGPSQRKTLRGNLAKMY